TGQHPSLNVPLAATGPIAIGMTHAPPNLDQSRRPAKSPIRPFRMLSSEGLSTRKCWQPQKCASG
ncbi:hypothetical protein ABTE14_21165, partial [Acinetobacter baumannii]